jgi:hypothetical protein
VFKCRWFAVYLHEFERSDHDRCLHDHPWGFVSIILRGGYWEEMFDNGYSYRTSRRWRRPGSILVRPAKTAHRIELTAGAEAGILPKPWSLVIVGRKSRAWGFWTIAGWREWSPGYSPVCETD